MVQKSLKTPLRNIKTAPKLHLFFSISGYEKLTPEQGCVSALKCLFGAVSSGHFYGEDGLRSPLTVQRDRGAPEYMGESNPDPAKYSNA